MRVLVVGNGAREHAIVWKLGRDDPQLELHAAPGNPGIAEGAECHSVTATDISGLVALARRLDPDLVVVGPEAPLAAGIGDALRDAGIAVFGPSAAAARIEASKRFAKELMLAASIPTARATWHRDATSARSAARQLGAPLVIKASGLAAGKGVTVCSTIAEAEAAIEEVLVARSFGAAGEEVLVEEFMEGEELSVFALSDGLHFRLMLPAQDHKRLLEGDRGPNTGGMGAYAPVSIADQNVLDEVAERIVTPTLEAMARAGCPFTGLLYCGLMLTDSGPKVVEFNCRFGDPETEAVLPLLRSRLLDFLTACSRIGGLAEAPQLEFLSMAAVTTVVAAAGYPAQPRIGDAISVGEGAEGALLFHAGTRRTADGVLRTAGGRVIAATAVAPSFMEARELSIRAAESVSFEGRYYRRDIGWREVQRVARTS